jgi:hypothetical protein
MGKHRSIAVLLICGGTVLVVLALAVNALRPQVQTPENWRFVDYVRKEAPLPEAVRQQENLDMVPFVRENAEFRNWLVGVLTSDDVDMRARDGALNALTCLTEEDAVRDVATKIVAWMSQPTNSGQQHDLRNMAFRMFLRDTVLLSDLPVGDALALYERGFPEWRMYTEAFLDPQPLKAGWKASDDEKRRIERLNEVLALAQRKDEERFMALLTEDAPLPRGKKPMLSDLPGLAEADPAFRKWLAGTVASPEPDYYVRGLAFKALLSMQSDEALRGCVEDLQPWFTGGAPGAAAGSSIYRRRISEFVLDRLLLTDMPVEEVLGLAKRAIPAWQSRAGTEAAGNWHGATPWTDEQRARIQERARQLMWYAKTGRAPGVQHQDAAEGGSGKPKGGAETQ